MTYKSELENERGKDLENARREVEDLAALLRRYQKEYYVDGRPSVSDLEYDRLFDRLVALEEKFPELKQADSPTVRVGSDLTESFPEVEHTVPVLSLDKAYTDTEVSSWIDRVTSRAGRPLTFVVEEKIDGVSIVLYYERGLLLRAVTRGNGYVGNDITANVKTIGSVPLRLPEEIDIAVRGEIYLPKDRFESLNRTMEIPFANPRNLAAGTLRRIKSSEVARVPLNIFVYEGFFTGENISHLEVLQKLSELGFRVSSRIGFFSNRLTGEEIHRHNPKWTFGSFEDLPGFIEKSAAERASLEYEIDGLVVKINELDVREELGSTGHHPRWAIAFKFESPQGITKIRSIDVQVGRTGRITPVARVEPVQIGGSTISNVTLHNQDYIDMLEIAPGDEVAVSRRGDVIPAVEKVVQKNEDGTPVWKMPDRCPSCGSPLEIHGAHHFCPNNECPDQVRGRLFFFIGRDQMDIENLGPETVEFLIEKGYIRDLPDLYRFDYRRLLDQPGFGEKKISLLQKGLQKSLDQPFHVVLPSLGIPEVGKKVTELLIDAGFTDIDMIFDLVEKKSPEALLNIKGIGEKTAHTIFEEFSRPELRRRVDELRSLGLKFSTSPSSEGRSRELENRPFTGQTWCVTGSFEHFKPRSRATDLIKAGGGKVTTQVSGSTTHLLVGSSAGSKLQKARETGTVVVSEEDFLRLLSEAGIDPSSEGPSHQAKSPAGQVHDA
jgi:DNA ligase (NAD+)